MGHLDLKIKQKLNRLNCTNLALDKIEYRYINTCQIWSIKTECEKDRRYICVGRNSNDGWTTAPKYQIERGYYYKPLYSYWLQFNASRWMTEVPMSQESSLTSKTKDIFLFHLKWRTRPALEISKYTLMSSYLIAWSLLNRNHK